MMEMPLPIELNKVVAYVKMASQRQDNIVAFGELHFYERAGDKPIFKVKGCTFRVVPLSPKTIITVKFPAFRSKMGKYGFQTSFITESESLLADLRKLLMDEYYQVSGGLTGEEAKALENVEPEEIPI